ncbi:hypothetical protein [Mucilaginibacter flavus]|uniref:hypothetical protein n=1 Tax=Mucilaginibacter flavus TaxID=931504 RepID=UPI0025B617CA|nr:hypothetical protein [Mucilaginibacter flavus]MDN3583988.1 hypothetical protein [Mucilaginibacter flavus]
MDKLSNQAKGALGEMVTKIKYAAKGYLSEGIAEVETKGTTASGGTQVAKYDHNMKNIFNGNRLTVESKFNTSGLTKNQRLARPFVTTPGGLLINRTTSQQLGKVAQSVATGGITTTSNQIKNN